MHPWFAIHYSHAVYHPRITYHSEIEILRRGFRFGLFRHVKAVHNEVLREQAERIKTTSDHRYKKDVRSVAWCKLKLNLLSVSSFQVRDDVAEDRAADDDDALDFEDEFNETVYTKPPSLPTFDMQDWSVIHQHSDFSRSVFHHVEWGRFSY